MRLEDTRDGLEDEIHVLLRRIGGIEVDHNALFRRVEQGADGLGEVGKS